MNKSTHWQDPMNAVLGVAILASPWAHGYQVARVPMANAVIVGASLFTIAVGAAVVGRMWVEWAVAALGDWLIVAPWVLDFRHEDASSTAIGFGIVVLALGLWYLLGDRLGRGRDSERRAKGIALR